MKQISTRGRIRERRTRSWWMGEGEMSLKKKKKKKEMKFVEERGLSEKEGF